MTECPWCGAEVEDGDARCRSCGRRVHATASPVSASASASVPAPLPPLPPPPPRRRRYEGVTADPLSPPEPRIPRPVEVAPEPEPDPDAVEIEEDLDWNPPSVTAPPPPVETPEEESPVEKERTQAEPIAAPAAAVTVPDADAEPAAQGDEFVWPPPWMPQEEATPLQRSKRLRVVVGVSAVVLVALIGAFIASRVADDGAADTEIKPTELQVGQCFNAPREELTSVQLRPCTEEHQHEVFAVVDHPASRNARYPGDDEILRFAGERCIPLFERYGSVPFEQANLADFEVVPTKDSWEGGERRVICAVSSLEGEMMRGSVRRQRS